MGRCTVCPAEDRSLRLVRHPHIILGCAARESTNNCALHSYHRHPYTVCVHPSRYATSAITQWKAGHRVGPCGIEDLPPPPPSPPPPPPPNTHAAGSSFPAGGAGAGPPSTVASGPGARVAAAGSGGSGGAAVSRSTAPLPLPLPHHGASCMSQLQKKQHQQQGPEAAEGRSTAMPPTPTVRFRVDGEPPPPPPPSGGGYRWHGHGSTVPPVGTGGSLGGGAGAHSPAHPYQHHAPAQPTSIMRKSLDDPDRAAGRGPVAYARGTAGPGTGQVRIQAQPAHGSSPFEGKSGLAWSPPGLPGALSDDGVQATRAGAEDPGAEQLRGQGQGQSSPVVGSPPVPLPSLGGEGECGRGGGGGGLRRIASKMSRSATRHSLIDLCKDGQD